MPERTVTVQDALRKGAERLALREDLRADAKRDAQQLLEIATGLDRVQMLAGPRRDLTPEQLQQFNALLEQRLRAVPIQYLRGSQEFYGRNFRVTPDVLIPRPETEDIVTAVLELVPDRMRPLRIADVGTGSGVLAITLALELTASTVTALDISPAALAVAGGNAEALSGQHDSTLLRRVRFQQSDLLTELPPGERFDIIVSNPPYIPLTDAPTLHPQVFEHEPHLALFGGDDGHDLYRRLIPQAWNRLVPGGSLLMETGGISVLLDTLLLEWKNVRYRCDLQGIDRIVAAQRP